jgi:phosphoglycolate phosphatase-like HAD superfamily hydrolase
MSSHPDGVEILNPHLSRGRFGAVLLDFDGTLSFLREGWPQIMTRMMVAVLRQAPKAEAEAELTHMVDAFIMRLNGKSTIHQMNQLAEEVRRRGGKPEEPLHYKQQYVKALMSLVLQRRRAVSSGRESAQQWTVPGSFRLLELLQARGLPLALASGTDYVHVQREAELLGLAHYFRGRIHAPQHEQDGFSKQGVIAELLRELQLPGTALLSFGDGMVETLEVKKVGGTAIGVASDLERPGEMNTWKRRQLIEAGADALVPDFTRAEELVTWLCY